MDFGVSLGYSERMSDLAYFEYANNQLEGTSAHYLVQVSISKRDEEELRRLANKFLTQALGPDMGQVGLKAISEPEAQKLKKLGSAGLYYDGAVFSSSKWN